MEKQALWPWRLGHNRNNNSPEKARVVGELGVIVFQEASARSEGRNLRLPNVE
jgi:hypothetical protein